MPLVLVPAVSQEAPRPLSAQTGTNDFIEKKSHLQLESGFPISSSQNLSFSPFENLNI